MSREARFFMGPEHSADASRDGSRLRAGRARPLRVRGRVFCSEQGFVGEGHTEAHALVEVLVHAHAVFAGLSQEDFLLEGQRESIHLTKVAEVRRQMSCACSAALPM